MTTLTILIVVAFVLGYACIATESLLKVNKAAIALLMFVACWTLYMFDPMQYLTAIHGYTGDLSGMAAAVTSIIQEHLGDTSTTLFFLMGAMTIVEIVDQNGGFNWVRKVMKTKSKRALLWRIAFLTFILSAILDNLTTSIVMIMILRKLVTARVLADRRRNDHHALEQGPHHSGRRNQRDSRAVAHFDGYPGVHPAVSSEGRAAHA